MAATMSDYSVSSLPKPLHNHLKTAQVFESAAKNAKDLYKSGPTPDVVHTHTNSTSKETAPRQTRQITVGQDNEEQSASTQHGEEQRKSS